MRPWSIQRAISRRRRLAPQNGNLWEIFEYVVDLLWPNVNMMSRETGIHDTMHDLIVDAVGAIIVGLMGYAYARSGRFSFLIDAVRAFMQKNPRWFGGKARRQRTDAR